MVDGTVVTGSGLRRCAHNLQKSGPGQVQDRETADPHGEQLKGRTEKETLRVRVERYQELLRDDDGSHAAVGR